MSTYHVVSIDIITHVVSDSACSSCPRKEVWQKYCAKAPSEFKINQITSAHSGLGSGDDTEKHLRCLIFVNFYSKHQEKY